MCIRDRDGRLALSFELAYLISQRTDTLSYLHIITYRRLKGVWKNKLYPIIWYHDPKAYLEKYQKEIAFEDSFTLSLIHILWLQRKSNTKMLPGKC